MRKLDWYIFKKLIITFFYCMILLTLVAVAVDISEKTDNFVKSGLSTLQITTQYYFGFIPFIWGLMFPLFVFISVIFVTSRMAARSEIVAILAAGISFPRMLWPYILSGLLLSFILWFGWRNVLPKANIIYGNFQTRYIDKYDPIANKTYSNCYNCYYLKVDSNTYIGIKNYSQETKTASQFFLNRLKGGKLVYNLRSNNIKWDTASKKWVVTDALERKIDSLSETITKLSDKKLSIKLTPEDLRKDAYLKDRLTTPQLVSYINKLKQRGSEGLNVLEVEKHRRLATSFTVLLLTFIGAVIASRKTRGGSGMHLALGVIIAAIFILSDRFSTVFATNSSLPPALAAWLPNIVFSIVSVFLYRRAPR